MAKRGKRGDPAQKRFEVAAVLKTAEGEGWSNERLSDAIAGILTPINSRKDEYVVDKVEIFAPIRGTPRRLLREYELHGTVSLATGAAGTSRSGWWKYRTKYNREFDGLWDKAVELIKEERGAVQTSRLSQIRITALNQFEKLLNNGSVHCVIKAMEALIPEFSPKAGVVVVPQDTSGRKPDELTGTQLAERIAELEKAREAEVGQVH